MSTQDEIIRDLIAKAMEAVNAAAIACEHTGRHVEAARLEEAMEQVEKAAEMARRTITGDARKISEIFVEPPASAPLGSCMSCGEMRPIVERTGMCDECSEIAYRMYPDTRPLVAK